MKDFLTLLVFIGTIVLLWTLGVPFVRADEAFVSYNISPNPPYPAVNGLSVGRINDISPFKLKYELGFINDRRVPNTLGFLMAGLGVRPIAGPVYASFFQSIGFLSGEDRYVSGYFQFSEDVSLGIKGKDGTFIGCRAKHFSNAGLKQPNVGKNLIGLEIGFDL